MKKYIVSLHINYKLVLIYEVLVILISSFSNIASIVYCICEDYYLYAPNVLLKFYTLVGEKSLFMDLAFPAIISPSYLPVIPIVSVIMTISLFVTICEGLRRRNYEKHLLKSILLSLLNPSIVLLVYLGLIFYCFRNW